MSTPKQTWKRPCLVVKDGNRNSLNERSSRMPWINSPWHLSQAPGLFQLHHTWLGSGGTFDYLSPEMVPRLKLKILTDPNCEASSCLVCKGITYIHITYTKTSRQVTKWAFLRQNVWFTTAPRWFVNLIFIWFWAPNLRYLLSFAREFAAILLLVKSFMRDKNGRQRSLFFHLISSLPRAQRGRWHSSDFSPVCPSPSISFYVFHN